LKRLNRIGKALETQLVAPQGLEFVLLRKWGFESEQLEEERGAMASKITVFGAVALGGFGLLLAYFAIFDSTPTKPGQDQTASNPSRLPALQTAPHLPERKVGPGDIYLGMEVEQAFRSKLLERSTIKAYPRAAVPMNSDGSVPPPVPDYLNPVEFTLSEIGNELCLASATKGSKSFQYPTPCASSPGLEAYLDGIKRQEQFAQEVTVTFLGEDRTFKLSFELGVLQSVLVDLGPYKDAVAASIIESISKRYSVVAPSAAELNDIDKDRRSCVGWIDPSAMVVFIVSRRGQNSKMVLHYQPPSDESIEIMKSCLPLSLVNAQAPVQSRP
jgi:hypothetical protein